MTPPTPAAVRWALRINYDEGSPEERAAYFADERGSEDMLADHIRAVAQEMREHAEHAERVAAVISKAGADVLYNYANDLRVFADKLEGKQ